MAGFWRKRKRDSIVVVLPLDLGVDLDGGEARQCWVDDGGGWDRKGSVGRWVVLPLKWKKKTIAPFRVSINPSVQLQTREIESREKNNTRDNRTTATKRKRSEMEKAEQSVGEG
ncbi:hypothetical protein MRB53_032612 [Persea americana]|uniref:Uncharacterized protein n=1 Tax=Persea americana TaxID=3435 RepID=A0ACC2KSQ0_PERAE|nr:hypothetical protein MRB53_032612 [Persea americana]